jgi:hypothetical protein
MLRFCGFDLELLVDKVLAAGDWPSLCSAHDTDGRRWLIAQVDSDLTHLMWVCAPVSERGLQSIMAGRGSPVDALRHSSTGTVELVTIEYGRAVPDRCLLCAEIPECWSAPPGCAALPAA